MSPDIMNPSDDIIIVAPDEGARDRLEFKMRNSRTVFGGQRVLMHCKKTRDSSGKVTNIEIDRDKSQLVNKKTKLIVIDDLCDGGSTFLAIHPKLKELGSSEVNLIITHSIQLEGLKKVASLYDNVVTSNSYQDFNDSDLPDNVTIIDINSYLVRFMGTNG